MSTFVPVLPAAQLPAGCPVATSVEGRPVCVVRVEGGVYAFDDVCPHRGTPLSEGRVHGTTITCRAHTWEFDVRTGELLRLRAPACLQMRRAREHLGMIEVAA
ncbi:MAG: putative rieske iron-sulfur family protein [Solirubrobacterales bacterium]|nr:putative rieske iron-sulfur family protein [Solirubrobacterales bacterium]